MVTVLCSHETRAAGGSVSVGRGGVGCLRNTNAATITTTTITANQEARVFMFIFPIFEWA